MNMKRFLLVGILGLFLLGFMGGALGVKVDVENKDATEAGETVRAGLMSFVDFVKALFGGLSPEDGETAIGSMQVITQFLFTILIAMLVYSSSGMFFEEGSFVHWTATAVISILAIISIPVNLLEVISIQYGVMGATLITAIPFAIIVFFTIKVRNLVIAYVTWVFFIIYYFYLFITKLFAGKDLLSPSFPFLTVDGIPYVLAIIAGIIMAVFLVRFRRWLYGATVEDEIEKAEQNRKILAAQLQAQKKQLEIQTGIKNS